MPAGPNNELTQLILNLGSQEYSMGGGTVGINYWALSSCTSLFSSSSSLQCSRRYSFTDRKSISSCSLANVPFPIHQLLIFCDFTKLFVAMSSGIGDVYFQSPSIYFVGVLFFSILKSAGLQISVSLEFLRFRLPPCRPATQVCQNQVELGSLEALLVTEIRPLGRPAEATSSWSPKQ